jgi:hypothetical protein
MSALRQKRSFSQRLLRANNRRNMENVFDMKKPILHIRLDQRVDAIELKEQQLDETIPSKAVQNPRVVSRDSARERSCVQAEENALIAERDKGPLEA